MKIPKSIASLVIGVSLLLAALPCAAAQAQAQNPPVVFALIDPMSGPFKEVGTEVTAVMEYAIENITNAGGLLGRQIKLNVYDDQMKPDIAVRMARRAVLEDGAKVIMNFASSAVALALARAAVELNVIHVVVHAETDEITGSQFQPNSFRICLSTSMHSGILAHYFAQSPYKRFYLINQDFAFGHAVADSFRKIFLKVRKPDQEIVGEDFHPLATKDFGPYVSKALAAKPDVVITGNFGPDLPGLTRQARGLGMKSIFGSYYLDNLTHMNQVRDSGLGSVTAEMYLTTIAGKKNQDLAKSWQAWFKKHYPDRPSFYLIPTSHHLAVDGMGFLAKAIKKAGTFEAKKIITAWEGLSYDGVAGKIFMRACDHQIQTPGFVAVIQADHSFKHIIDFPYLGDPVTIPLEKVSIAPKETGNPRCK